MANEFDQIGRQGGHSPEMSLAQDRQAGKKARHSQTLMNRLDVSYQGQKVGTLAEVRGGICFEYDAVFIATGHELSPLNLPLGYGLRSRGVSGMWLPGLFEDSLPDQWGERLMREWFRLQGIAFHAVTPLMKLAYVGRRGHGEHSSTGPSWKRLMLAAVSACTTYTEAAMQVEYSGEIDLGVLAEVGTSAGGARPKGLIGLPHTGR